jgi:hypothetical protein
MKIQGGTLFQCFTLFPTAAWSWHDYSRVLRLAWLRWIVTVDFSYVPFIEPEPGAFARLNSHFLQ